MDEDLIRRWNETVTPADTVWHLGDFALGDQRNVRAITQRLNGTIHLCWGNHDRREIVEKQHCFASTQDVAMIRVGGDRVFLSHYGHRVWNGSHKGNFHLYGHSHGGLEPIARSLDVGVDEFDYRPVTLDQVKARLAELNLLELVTGHHHR
ncbi:MAG: metallophosphoesterase [Oxalobacteraceae bacterium]|nr:MAG: metallophosphoesterase [Oxalobacteraceae bacterium]